MHDLRVAARRLRAVLEVFEWPFPKKPHRRLLDDVKEAADALGAARDLDVQLALLETFRDAAGPAERPGIEGLIEELRPSGPWPPTEVEPALDELDDGRVAVYLVGPDGGDVKAQARQGARPPAQRGPQHPADRAHAPRRGAVASTPRCATRRRRRSCTTSASPASACATCSRSPGTCFGPAGAAAEKEARWLQDVLGEIHDCDVLRPRIERHLETLRESDARALEGLVKGDADGLAAALRKAPNRTAYRGLGALESAVVARRALLYERFLSRWLGLVEDGFAPGLEPQLS